MNGGSKWMKWTRMTLMELWFPWSMKGRNSNWSSHITWRDEEEDQGVYPRESRQGSEKTCKLGQQLTHILLLEFETSTSIYRRDGWVMLSMCPMRMCHVESCFPCLACTFHAKSSLLLGCHEDVHVLHAKVIFVLQHTLDVLGLHWAQRSQLSP